MRLGILGGSFDPVHYAHLLAAESAREQCRLDEVWFIPAATPPHKQQLRQSDAAARVEMLELAIAGHAPFRVSRLEIERGGVSYTVDTLEELKRQDPARELFLIIGADSLADLPTWRHPARICELALPVVLSRPGMPLPDYTVLAPLVSPARFDEIRRAHVEMPLIQLSSTDIRRRVSAGRSIRFRTPRAVERYIETHGLYRGDEAAAEQM